MAIFGNQSWTLWLSHRDILLITESSFTANRPRKRRNRTKKLQKTTMCYVWSMKFTYYTVTHFCLFVQEIELVAKLHCSFWRHCDDQQQSLVTYRLVPDLKNMPVPVLVTLKIRYTNRKAQAQRPFLLAGELAHLPAEF